MRCKGIAHIALAAWLAALGAEAQQVAHDVHKKGAPTKSAATPGNAVQVASEPAKKSAPSPKAGPPTVVTKQDGNTVQAGGVPTAAESKQTPKAQKPSADRVSLDAPGSASSAHKSAASQHTVKPPAPAPKPARPPAENAKRASKQKPK